MRHVAALVVLLAICDPRAALSQSHSADDEAACTPDVMRLCQEFIPNRDAIIGCLVQKKKEMSPECSKVFARPRVSDSDRRRQRGKSAAQASE